MVLQNFNSTDLSFEVFDIVTRSGVTWKPLTSIRVGRLPQAAVFNASAGLTNAVKNRVSKSPFASWKMFIDEPMLRKILNCTVAKGQTHKSVWSITIEILEAYLALEYARGIYGKGHSTNFGV